MRVLVLFTFLLFVQFGFSQTSMDFDGFGPFRVGMSMDDAKKLTTETDDAPDYAWFKPFSAKELREKHGDAADFYIQMQEEDSVQFSEMNFVRRWCVPKKASDKKFFGLSIECMEFIFEEDILVTITVVLDKKDVTFDSKEFLKLDMLRQMSEEPFCSGAANYNPPPSTCVWYSDETGQELTFSDAMSSIGPPGESVNIVFGVSF